MSLLNLGDASQPSVQKSLLGRYKKIGLGVALIAFVATLSTTLAGTITINSGTSGNNSVTFGQGVATTASCDDQINLSPTSTYTDDQDNHQAFHLDNLTISDIAASCLNKRLLLSIYDLNGSKINSDPIAVDYTYDSNSEANVFTEPYVTSCTEWPIPWNVYPPCHSFWGLTYPPSIVETLQGSSRTGGGNTANSGAGENSFVLHNVGSNCNMFTYGGDWCDIYSSDAVRVTIESTEIPSGTEEAYDCTWQSGCAITQKNAASNYPKQSISASHSRV